MAPVACTGYDTLAASPCGYPAQSNVTYSCVAGHRLTEPVCGPHVQMWLQVPSAVFCPSCAETGVRSNATILSVEQVPE